MTGETDSHTHTFVTTTVLLEGLRDPRNQAVWDEFVQRYRPMVLLYARRLGLNSDDAQDVAQQSLLSFYTAYTQGKYQREKGRLRHWLFGIARHHVIHVFEQRSTRRVEPAGGGGLTGALSNVPAEDQLEQLWEQEWSAAVLRRCLQIVRSEFGHPMSQAFELFAWQGWPAKRVAEHLGMSENAVFIAKHRVLKRVRELMPDME